MSRDPKRSGDSCACGDAPDDEASARALPLRQLGSGPYRDRRETLLARRGALEAEVARAERAVERASRALAHIRAIDEELRGAGSPAATRELRGATGVAAYARDFARAGLLFLTGAVVAFSIAVPMMVVDALDRARMEATLAAWEKREAEREARAGDAPRESAPPRAAPLAPPPSDLTAPAVRVLDGTSLASHARAIDDHTFEIDRTFVERMLSGESSASAPRLRAIPHVRDGRTIGVKLFGVRRDSAFGLLGFQNGDLLLSIDGYDIAVPDQALEAYARLRDATTHGILLERRGAPRLHVLRVVDDR